MGGGGLWAGFGRGLWRVRSRVVCLLVFGMAGWMIVDLFEMFGVLEWLVLLFHGL